MPKKDKNKLRRKEITNKLGKRQVVLVLPDQFVKKVGYRKSKEELGDKKTGAKLGQPNENVNVFKRGNVPIVTKKDFEKKYGKDSITYKIITGKFKYGDNGINLKNKDWSKLLNEHGGFIAKQAARFNYGNYNGEQFNELKQIGIVGFLEGVNKYKKVLNSDKPYDFGSFVFNYVTGRMKEAISKELRAGIQIPKHLILPFQQYTEIRNRLTTDTGNTPTKIEIARELQKIWNKKTFNPNALLSEQRKYAKIKGKKEYVEFYEDDNKDDFEKVISFKNLPNEFKNKFKEDDVLPLTGYTTSRTGKARIGKREIHEQNLSKIEKRFNETKKRLSENFSIDSITEDEEFENRKKLIKTVSDNINKKQKEYENVKDNYLDKVKSLNEDMGRINEGINKLDLKIDDEKDTNKIATLRHQRELLSHKSNDMFSVSYQEKYFKDNKEKLEKVSIELKKLKSDYETIKQIYPTERMTEEQYDKEVKRIDLSMGESIRNEVRRFGRDDSSILIPGIMERVAEFENIDSLKNLRLDVGLDMDDDNSISPVDFIYVPQLNPEEEVEVREEHKKAKQGIINGINYLVPNFSNALKLHLGLHEDSKKQEGEIWGELSTTKDIVKWFDDRKLVDDKTIGENITSMVNSKNKIEGKANAATKLVDIPFLRERFQDNPELVKSTYEKWLSEKPNDSNTSEKQKVKKSTKELKADSKQYKQNIVDARLKFRNWLKKHLHDTDLKQRKKKYDKIKDEMHATKKYRPTKFKEEVVNKKVTKDDIKKWESNIPSFTYNNQNDKEIWTSRILEKARDIIVKVIPLEEVRNLIRVHRQMIEHGILEKGFIDMIGIEFNMIYL